MAMVHRTVSISSLASMSEEFITSTKRFSVTEGFKRNWLQNTLSFIKDEQKQTLNYGVTPAQAVFIRNMLNFEDDPSIQKGVYTPLYEALKIFGLRYTFKLSWLKTDLLVLTKIRKTSNKYRSQLEPDASTNTTKKGAKVKEKAKREMSVMDKLSQNYMVDIAKRILDFMQDNTRATLEFTRVKPLESLFMQSVLNASRPMFPEHASMMQFVNRMKPTMDYNLQVFIGKVDKKTNERTVTFKKDPKFPHVSRSFQNSKNSNGSSPTNDKYEGKDREGVTHQKKIARHKVRSSSTNRLDLRKAKLLEDMSMPVQLDKPARMMQMMGWNGGPLGCRGVGITEPIIPTLDLVSGAGLGHARKTLPVNISQPDLISKPDIPCQQDLSKPDLTLQENIPNLSNQIATRQAPETKSQPDRLPKPDLSKPVKCPKSYPFRMDMLQAVLNLIKSDSNTFELVYSNKIKKKDIKFVRNAVISFAEYKRLGLNDADEVAVFGEIITMLKKFPNFVIFATVSGCYRKVILRREFKRPEKRSLQPPVVINVNNLQTIAETMSIYNDENQKDKIHTGFRVAVLCEILHMYGKNIQHKELFCDKKFNKRHMVFIKEALTAINMGNIPKSCKKRGLERGICGEIINRIGDTILTVNFDKPVNMSAHFQILTHNNSFAPTIQTYNSSDIIYSNNEFACTKHYSWQTIDLIRINNNSNSINNVREVTFNNTQVLNDETKDKNASTTKTWEIVSKSTTVTFYTKDTENNNINNEQTKHHEMDDDVMIIEKEVEIIDISDDESINPISQSTQNCVEEMSLLSAIEKQDLEIRITSVKGNVMIDETRSQGNVEVFETLCDELDLSKGLNSLDIGDMTNGDCLNAGIATSEGYLSTCRGEDCEEFNNTAGNKHLTAVLNSSESTVPVDKEICVVTAVKPDQGVEISKLDIVNDLDATKVIPKKEKLSYSEEFDTDLYNLAKVLDLDEEIFDYKFINTDRTGISMSKRSRSDSEQSSPDNSKKTKIFTFDKFKNLLIVPKNYPEVNLKRESMVEIQMILSEAIENCRELPLLQCHGIQDGGLLYSCHDEQSVFFVQNSLSVTSNYKIVNDVIIKKKPHKMKIKVNLLLDDIKKLLNRLELYNAGLITDSWHVKDVLKSKDYILMTVELDQHSFKYICDNSFCLYAGVDKAQFTIVWD